MGLSLDAIISGKHPIGYFEEDLQLLDCSGNPSALTCANERPA